MKNSSLRVQLSAVFLGFLLLVISSVTVTYWLAQTQQHDAAIINLAGRQRMLAQQMTRLALTDPKNPELSETIAHFEQTLSVLTNGGEIVDGNGRSLTLPPTTHPTTHTLLQEIATIWPTFKNQLHAPVNSEQLQAEFATLLPKLDKIVSTYETQAKAKINRLYWVQFIFLTTAFLLLAWGYLIVYRRLLYPLHALGTSAHEIGAGNLDKPFPSLPNNELGRLGQTMSTMRTEIAEHQNSLEQQVAQRTQELSTAFAFSQEIVRELEPEQLLQSVADHTCAVMKGTAVSVCVLNQQADTLELVASSGTTDTYLGLKQSTNRGLAAPVISEHKTVISEGHCANCGFLDHFPSASCIAAPLQVGGRSLGALCVVRPERLFDDNEARVLTLLANAAAVSLENTHLIAAAKQQAKENASLAERERLAADLHDNLAQTLGAMHLSIDQLSVKLENGSDTQVQRRVAQLQSSLKHAYVQVRMALTGLQEKVPDPGEFIMTIKSLLAEFEDKTGMAVEMVMDGEKGGGVTAVIQKQAVYIIREALTNVCRHAQATHAKIFITHALGTITIMISDNGIGFDPEQVQSQNHLGLTIMRARAERSRGQFTIQSAPGHGTRITVTFPTHSAIPRSEEVI